MIKFEWIGFIGWFTMRERERDGERERERERERENLGTTIKVSLICREGEREK